MPGHIHQNSQPACSQTENKLFNDAKKKWPGVFVDDATLDMQKATAKSYVKELQNVKLFNSNLEIADDAFEHLVNQSQKEGMGAYRKTLRIIATYSI